jgi:Tfp pilus assembly protein FimT
MRPGTTLVELLLVVSLVAATTAVAIPAIVRLRDRVSVRLAATDVAGAIADARRAAFTAARRTAVRIDETHAAVAIHAGADTLRTLTLAPYGVRLRATRDSIAFGPHGLGWGAATTTITLERGGARTALAVSRLGRVRRG